MNLKPDGKVRLDLLPFDALTEVAKAYEHGNLKYEEWNWLLGAKWSRYIAATLRHLFAWALGEDKDPDSGLSHLAHAGASVLILLTYERRGLGEDDRPKMKGL